MRVVSALVMAAGRSTRMGGPNKLLLPWGDCTVVKTTVRALPSTLLNVVVITGRDAELVAQEVSPVSTVFNKHYEKGLGSSIVQGVSEFPDSDGYLIVLGDMPDLKTFVVQALLNEFEGAELDAIVAPVYEDEPNRTGHPVLFGAAYRQQLLQLSGDEGAKGIIQAHRHKLISVHVANSLKDIDTPQDIATNGGAS